MMAALLLMDWLNGYTWTFLSSYPDMVTCQGVQVKLGRLNYGFCFTEPSKTSLVRRGCDQEGDSRSDSGCSHWLQRALWQNWYWHFHGPLTIQGKPRVLSESRLRTHMALVSFEMKYSVFIRIRNASLIPAGRLGFSPRKHWHQTTLPFIPEGKTKVLNTMFCFKNVLTTSVCCSGSLLAPQTTGSEGDVTSGPKTLSQDFRNETEENTTVSQWFSL